jgi:hypothetical protein
MPQQPQPPPQKSSSAPPPPPEAGLSATKYEQQASGDEGMTEIKRGIIQWATAPPSHQNLKPIEQLLATVPETFPPAYGVSNHDYFKNWKPFAADALAGREEAVLKRGAYNSLCYLSSPVKTNLNINFRLALEAMRKTKFFCKFIMFS